MKLVLVQLLVAVAAVSASTIQLESTQGILIPAPIAQSFLRSARSAYGGSAGSSYSAPAAPSYSSSSASSYSAPAAAPSYSAPAAAPSYSAPAAAPSYSAPAAPSYSAPAAHAAPSYSAPAAHAAPSYSPSMIPSPPCPKNYLFSCSPNLSPVPCSAPSGGGYSAHSVGAALPPHLQGAYSEVIPQYAVPIINEVY